MGVPSRRSTTASPRFTSRTTSAAMAPSVVSAKKQTKVKTAPHKFVIDYSGPANDKFLDDHIKVEGKTGQLGEDVKLQREAAGKLSVTSTVPFSKRYLKYLTKKFLKKHQMREWLRVVSTGKDTYTL